MLLGPALLRTAVVTFMEELPGCLFRPKMDMLRYVSRKVCMCERSLVLPASISYFNIKESVKFVNKSTADLFFCVC